MELKLNGSKPIAIILLLTIGLFLIQCTKDETFDETFNVSGIVTYAGGIPANGAIVIISSDEAGTALINSVVCMPDGEYSISGLLEGTYYLSSTFNTENVNNLKSTGFNFKTPKSVEIEVLDDAFQDLELVNEIGGTDVINTVDVSWVFDKAHSNVNWATAYIGQNAFLTGKFNSFGIDIDFDESVPENTTINAWVQLSTANTGEPGRDYLGGCLNGYLGVELDTTDNGILYVSNPDSDKALFESVSVTAFGDGYKAVGDFTFKGITKSVDLYFNYIGQSDFSSEGDGSDIRGGFTGEFEFLAISDFGVTSTSIADKILVTINANYRKK